MRGEVTYLFVLFSDSACRKNASLLEKVENVQIFPLAAFKWLWYRYLFCSKSTFVFKPELQEVQPFWFTLHQWRAEKDWLAKGRKPGCLTSAKKHATYQGLGAHDSYASVIVANLVHDITDPQLQATQDGSTHSHILRVENLSSSSLSEVRSCVKVEVAVLGSCP